MRTVAILLSALLASSCLMSRDKINEPLAREKIQALVVGLTTATDVAATLGAPNDVIQLGNRSAWRYDYTVEKSAGFTLIVVTFLNTDIRSDRCWLFFDKEGVLRHIGSTYDADDTEYALPWEDVQSGS